MKRFGKTTVAALGTLFALLGALPPASAATAQGQWAGNGKDPCNGATCTVDATSDTCAEVTDHENVTISISGCSAVLTGTHSRLRANGQYRCVGVGTGTLTYTDANNVTYPGIPVTIVVDDGTLTYHGTAVAGVDLFKVQGVVTPACLPQNGTFTGTLTRA